MGPPAPAEEAGTSVHSRTETDVESEQGSPGPELKDDGSVPDKQLSRWKNEGGSWLPTD
jgi:hypothetical protein